MNRTLPLFEGRELEGHELGGTEPEPGRHPAGAAAGNAHLRAAWRLSRGMWRFPDHSPEQTRAGLAICRHLQALLQDAEEAGRRD